MNINGLDTFGNNNFFQFFNTGTSWNFSNKNWHCGRVLLLLFGFSIGIWRVIFSCPRILAFFSRICWFCIPIGLFFLWSYFVATCFVVIWRIFPCWLLLIVERLLFAFRLRFAILGMPKRWMFNIKIYVKRFQQTWVCVCTKNIRAWVSPLMNGLNPGKKSR